MSSFIELPRLAFNGQPRPSVHVNTADIIMVEADHSGQTNVLIREMGSQGTGIVQTYVPLAAVLNALLLMARQPDVWQWSTASLEEWVTPIADKLAAGYARERGA